jgi:hypothetical protein
MTSRARAFVGLLAIAATQGHAQTTELVSYTLAGRAGGGQLRDMSADGRWIFFESENSQIVTGDTNRTGDHFLRDRLTGQTLLVTVSTSGQQANVQGTAIGSVSRDGRYVAFGSMATNLVPGDTNATHDVFLRDTVAGTTERISLTSSGAQANDASDGGFVSDDGRYVLFTSEATNLTAPSAAEWATYLRDRVTRRTYLISPADALDQCLPTAISGDGRTAAFRCAGGPALLRELPQGPVEVIADVATANDISPDGRYVLVSSSNPLSREDTNDADDVYFFDRTTRTFELASLGVNGQRGNDHSFGEGLSADGRYVLFFSRATNLRPNDTNEREDLYLRDRVAGTTTLVGVNAKGQAPADGFMLSARLSDDGRTVAFETSASNMGPLDTNGTWDTYVRLLEPVVSPASFTVRPRELAFGAVTVGAVSAAQTVTVTNTGASDIALAWVGVAGTDKNDFDRTRMCPGTLPPGATCNVTVTFGPATIGPSEARLVVSTKDGARKSAALSGTGR